MKKKSTSQSAPARRSLGEGGFFNLRVLLGLVLALAGVCIALLGFGAFSNASAQANATQEPKAQLHAPPRLAATPMAVRGAAATDRCATPRLQSFPREANLNPQIPHQHQDGPDPWFKVERAKKCQAFFLEKILSSFRLIRAVK